MTFPRLHPRERERLHRAMVEARRGGFNPAQVGKIKRWYRLAASTPVSGEYETVVEVLGGSSLAQTDADRKPVAAAAANSLPMAEYDGSDMLVMTLDTPGTGNNATDRWEMHGWFKAAGIGADQRLFTCTAASGASANKLDVMLLSNGSIRVNVFIAGTGDGRSFTTGMLLSNGQIYHLRVAYDKDGATDTDKLRLWFGGNLETLTPANVGAGGPLGALSTVTGTAVLGARNNSDTPTTPILSGSQTGPNLTFADAILTDAEASNLRNFEVPT